MLQIPEIDFELPKNWRVRGIWAPRFWTQIALSLEMLLEPPDVLFVPAHTVPLIHPARNTVVFYKWDITWLCKLLHFFGVFRTQHNVAGGPRKTVVTVHGLEYELCPQAYSLWARLYMRLSIQFSCRVAETIICVSQNTKRDVMRWYKVPEKKTRVIYEGYETNLQFPTRLPDGQVANFQSNLNFQSPISKPYLLFIGRLEERKNIVRIIEAFEVLKEKYQIPHQLVLIGKPGYGYARIMYYVSRIKHQGDVILLGYVTETEKWELLKNADVFVFPTLYEGFGIPVLEAQSAGVPVVTSDSSSLPEVAGEGAAYVDPLSMESIAQGIWRVLSDATFRGAVVEKGKVNVSRFSWEQSAAETANVFLNK